MTTTDGSQIEAASRWGQHGSDDHGGDLAEALAVAARDVEGVLDELLPVPAGPAARVADAMRYAVFAGGKRLRPFLVLECAGLFDAPRRQALRTAAAIEALHTYSLVHDDLPAMDDDDLRRGMPTVHRKYDEATAILAGDGLLTLAFEILADAATHPDAETRTLLVAELARAAGSAGMIGGQMMDMEASAHRRNPEAIIELQRKKTGALFEFCCVAGGRLGGATADEIAALRAYARDFGLAFQICDDLIDVLGAAELAGKAVGKDQAQGKATLVGIYGVERARAEAERLATQARSTLAAHGPAAGRLRDLPFYLLDRRK